MNKFTLRNNEAIIGKVKSKSNRVIIWSILSVLSLGGLITYLVFSVNKESWNLFNIILIVLIVLLFIYLIFKVLILIIRYRANEFFITNQRIYAFEFDFLKKVETEIEYSKIVNVIVRYSEVMRVYDVRIYLKKKFPGMTDSEPNEIGLVIDSVSLDDYSFIVQAIEKYRK